MTEQHPVPEHGWTCFHCGDTFHDARSARDHFGFDQECDPACRIKAGAETSLLGELRRAEAEVCRLASVIQAEGFEALNVMRGQAARHSAQLQTMEELGYERGLADGRAEASPA